MFSDSKMEIKRIVDAYGTPEGIEGQAILAYANQRAKEIVDWALENGYSPHDVAVLVFGEMTFHATFSRP